VGSRACGGEDPNEHGQRARAGPSIEEAACQEEDHRRVQALERAQEKAEQARWEVCDAEIVEGVQGWVQERPQRCRHQIGVEPSVDERVAIVEMVSVQVGVDVLTQHQ
jgi:hypothetical protein